jgi:hypothetical protein
MLEKGSTAYPTGNLIVYSKVIGENPFHAGYEIIASHIVVSFLKINENMPVVTFPPISFPSLIELQEAISKNMEFYDIAKLPDFIMPEDTEAGNRYLKERMEQYNNFVLRYVELCKNKEKNMTKLNQTVDENNNFTYLLEESLNYRSSTGLSKEISKQKFEKIIQDISIKYPTLDLENYKNVIYSFPGSKGDELASLYLKKFNAIQREDYEKASQLKQKIHDIEAGIL